MKKLVIALNILVALTILSGFTPDNKIKMYFNTNLLFPDTSPVLENGRTLVPIRLIAETLNAQVAYDSKKRTVEITKGYQTVFLTIGSSEAFIDTRAVQLDVPPRIVNGRTMVPLRFVSESFDVEVEWNNITKSVFIYKLDDSGKVQLADSKYIAKVDPEFRLFWIYHFPNGSAIIEGGYSDPEEPESIDSVNPYYFNSKTGVLKQFSDQSRLLNNFEYLDDESVWAWDYKIGTVYDDNNYMVFYDFNPNTEEKKELFLISIGNSGGGANHGVSIKKEMWFTVLQEDLYKINEKGEQTKLTNTPETIEPFGFWSPDGEQIAYLSIPIDKKKNYSISIMNSDGTGQIKLPVPLEGLTGIEWCPKGDFIAYANFSNTKNVGMWVVETNGTNAKRLLTDNNINFIKWSPDGSKLLAARLWPKEIEVVNLDGSSVKTTYIGSVTNCVWWDDNNNILYLKDQNIYYWDLQNNRVTPLVKGDVRDFWIAGNTVYYLKRNEIWKADLLTKS